MNVVDCPKLARDLSQTRGVGEVRSRPPDRGIVDEPVLLVDGIETVRVTTSLSTRRHIS
jgi:hypothetical protein